MGAMMRDRNPLVISVEEVMTGAVYSVAPDDDVTKALETMQEHKVRRLPVVDADGQLKGLLSMNDITLQANEPEGKKAPEMSFGDVMETYKAICAHPIPAERDQWMTAGA
jgi:CBS-domain-containing membrane protein